MTETKVYLLGDSEQGCGFSPVLAFRTAEDRDRYVKAVDEIFGRTHWYNREEEEMEFVDVDAVIAEQREWKARQDARIAEHEAHMKAHPELYPPPPPQLYIKPPEYYMVALLDKIAEPPTDNKLTTTPFSWNVMDRERKSSDPTSIPTGDSASV